MNNLIREFSKLFFCKLLGKHKYELWYKEVATLKFCKWCNKQE